MVQVRQIKIGKHQTGIVGLDEALKETAEECQGFSDQKISSLLIQKLSPKNYIPSSAIPLYESTLLREYKKFMGEPIQEPPLENVEIKVLGAGCPNCDRLEQDLMILIAETGIEADLEHVRDIREIGQYGVMGSPALVINGKVKAVGSVPSPARLREMILAADAEIKHQ
jgi:small redox-active disulfide protein 2